ncbi:type III secretion system export apparatus subunit SctV [Bradyrhizobium xenonodulans]|uniref:Type III secretion system export apparatus subunit SctV n=1 Tax=Bradyrhizobium xenonodulans TaxID=2736875 RepID=A0ABY7MVB5_9BRAD|nr:type III secretion system export apparatus subunit SctV [Bradyrhizobium xenonodulans]WBL81372.1 type III secretion system export apparatus subunit SctV [Bradyrhizobium xenonodulans]
MLPDLQVGPPLTGRRRFVTSQLRALLARVPSHPDLLVAAVLLLAVAMMILPMPLWLVDLLIGFNLGFSVLMLMVALYILAPLDFSSLPGIILISTVFRLALAITTTRLILSQAEAGEIIRTFGEFVIGGNVIVGLVVFLIVTLVQFIVIAKGAERVAEVAARFTLDALPGKQMAIDAEMRNGDIDQTEARRRRANLESESQLYGAMDGAMKFVKGDAIAGLVVIVVNLVGGISIGTLSRGLSFGSAIHEYSLLTIGDALISQIPALLLSLTAGTVVTRVTGDRQVNLGRDIVGQLGASTRALRLSAVVLLGLGLVPGFPTPVFLVLALIFGAISLLKPAPSREGQARPPASPAQSGSGVPAVTGVRRAAVPGEVPAIILRLAPALGDRIDEGQLSGHIDRLRTQLSARLGILIPEVAILREETLGDAHCRVDIEGVPVEEYEARLDELLVIDDLANLDLLNIPIEPEQDSRRMGWVDIAHAALLRDAGIGFRTAEQVMAHKVSEIVARYASRFVGIQETRALLARIESGYADLVKEALRTVPVPRIADVLRRLVDEGVCVNNTRLVLEALAEWGEKESNVVLLTEYVRAALKRQICYSHANAHRAVMAYVLEREAEDVVRGAIRDTAVGPYLVLDERSGEQLLAQFRRMAADAGASEVKPVVLASMDVRRYVRGYIVRNGLELAVLSYQDLAGDFMVQPVGSVSLNGPRPDMPARSAAKPAQPPPRDALTAA